MQPQPSSPQPHLPQPSRARLWLLLPLAAALGCNAVVHISGCSNPSVTAIAPSTAPAGGLQFNLSVTGSNFRVNSVVTFNGGALPTTFVNSQQLQATVPAGAISTPGTPPVSVMTPDTSGTFTCQGNNLVFVVTN